ncbi:MAG: energy transducer TonB [Bacteroidia bacterium]|nr:energy transducer TonB [Bacteroidia bacterium]
MTADTNSIKSTRYIEPDPDGNYFYVDERPDFKEGWNGLYKFIALHLNYPKRAKKEKIQGKCFVKFVVNANGTIGKIEIINGVSGCSECDAEVIKVVKKLPKFTPGKVNGKAVPVWFQMPISFNLQ